MSQGLDWREKNIYEAWLVLWGTLSLDMMLEMFAGCSTYTKMTKRIYCDCPSSDETFYMLAT